MSDLWTLRRRLLHAALDLAAIQVGPYNETNDRYYDASVEYGEELLDHAAREYVAALSDQEADR